MNANGTVLQARNLTIRRSSGTAARTILSGARLALRKGTLAHLKGPSGSGKSTLLWVLARMLPRESGELSLLGRPAAEIPAPVWRMRVALVLQKHAMVFGTVRENLTLPWRLKVRRGAEVEESGSKPPSDEVLRRELDTVRLDDVSLDEDASRLSVGQTARVSLVRTLVTRPDCLLLDEPTAALDPETADLVTARILAFAAGGAAVLMAGHGAGAPRGAVFRIACGELSEEAQ
jgi:putative ABC transport system ATP-binding protein